MQWSEKYAVGIKRIDDQHKMLFQIIDDYGRALAEHKGERTYETFLRTLRAYSRGHFELEETCMDRYRCPVAQDNKTAHANFTAKIAEYEALFETRMFVRQDALDLVAFLEEWVGGHICTIDVQLRDFVTNGVDAGEADPETT